MIEDSIKAQKEYLERDGKFLEEMCDKALEIEQKLKTHLALLNGSIGTGVILKLQKGGGGLGLFKELYVKDSGSYKKVSRFKSVRSSLVINGQKFRTPINTKSLVAEFTRHTLIKELLTEEIKVLRLKKGQITHIEQLPNIFPDIVNYYFDVLEELSDAVFEFNRVGGEFTKNYKILARFDTDERLKDPFLRIGRVGFFQVWGGSRSKGKRFTRPITKLKGIEDHRKLTRKAVRATGLTRFEKEYLEKAKRISIKSQELLNIKEQITYSNKVLEKCRKQV